MTAGGREFQVAGTACWLLKDRLPMSLRLNDAHRETERPMTDRSDRVSLRSLWLWVEKSNILGIGYTCELCLVYLFLTYCKRSTFAVNSEVVVIKHIRLTFRMMDVVNSRDWERNGDILNWRFRDCVHDLSGVIYWQRIRSFSGC